MKQQLIKPANNHIFVCGITRSGKTYFVKNACDKLKYPVLFLNIQGETMPAKFMKVNETVSSATLLNILRMVERSISDIPTI